MGGGKPAGTHKGVASVCAVFWVYLVEGTFLGGGMCSPRPLPQTSCLQFKIRPLLVCSASPRNRYPSSKTLIWCGQIVSAAQQGLPKTARS